MPTATVRFHRCIQDSQEYGSDDEHMVSRVSLSLQRPGIERPIVACNRREVGEEGIGCRSP